MTGIQNLNEVAPQGQIVYNALLKALDNVYQEGKGQSPKATPLKAEQISAIFSLAGFTQDEVNSLNNKGSDEARCSAGGKIYSVIGKLKPEYKPLYARYMLSQG